MSDDLEERLINHRIRTTKETYDLMHEAADRIKQLEAALREITALGFWDGDRAMDIARIALEGKKDD